MCAFESTCLYLFLLPYYLFLSSLVISSRKFSSIKFVLFVSLYSCEEEFFFFLFWSISVRDIEKPSITEKLLQLSRRVPNHWWFLLFSCHYFVSCITFYRRSIQTYVYGGFLEMGYLNTMIENFRWFEVK